MDRELLEYHLNDRSRVGELSDPAWRGSAGGSACGDLIRITIQGDRSGTITAVRFEAEGCAALRACAAALGESLEGLDLLAAARLGEAEIATAVGGLGTEGAHAAYLVADAAHRALGLYAADGIDQLAAPETRRVLVGLSGGVDSSVAAWLEREQGAEVIAVTVKSWSDPAGDGERSCCSPQAVLGAREIAHSLGFPHLTLDLEAEFARAVVEPFLEGYRDGVTPNPCVRCNGSVRLDAMSALAQRLGAESLITGHYARIADDGEGPLLQSPADPAKDQTYMLCAVEPDVLSRIRFPLAALTKSEVRTLAAEAGLASAERPESQDLCFLAGVGKSSFLERHGGLGDQPGPIVDLSGKVLGRHQGQHRYTVGQRRGLGLGGRDPLYVAARESGSNTVTVAPREALETRRVQLREARLYRDSERVDSVRLRYHAPARRAGISGPGYASGRYEELEVELDEPAWAVAPGQTAVLLAGETVVGYGTIA